MEIGLLDSDAGKTFHPPELFGEGSQRMGSIDRRSHVGSISRGIKIELIRSNI
jgi:hypothetical protein